MRGWLCMSSWHFTVSGGNINISIFGWRFVGDCCPNYLYVCRVSTNGQKNCCLLWTDRIEMQKGSNAWLSISFEKISNSWNFCKCVRALVKRLRLHPKREARSASIFPRKHGINHKKEKDTWQEELGHIGGSCNALWVIRFNQLFFVRKMGCQKKVFRKWANRPESTKCVATTRRNCPLQNICLSLRKHVSVLVLQASDEPPIQLDPCLKGSGKPAEVQMASSCVQNPHERDDSLQLWKNSIPFPVFPAWDCAPMEQHPQNLIWPQTPTIYGNT